MAWTKKTGTLPDKIRTLIVVDTSDGNRIKDLGTSGCEEDVNLGTCTFTNGTDRVNKTGHGLSDGDRVYFTVSGGSMPTGLSAVSTATSNSVTNTYYVVNATSNDFQLSLTSGGAAVDFSDDGSGTITLYKLLGITPAENNSVVTLTRTDRTSDAWGVGVLLDQVGNFNPHRLIFTDMGNGLPPSMTNPTTAGYTQVLLSNRVLATTDYPLLTHDAATIPSLGYELTENDVFALKYSNVVSLVLGTSAATLNVPTAVAVTGKRHADAECRLYYDLPSSNSDGTVTGAFALEGGPTPSSSVGATAAIKSIGYRAQNNLRHEMFAFAVADQNILSESELNLILQDPIGTLVEVGAGASVGLLAQMHHYYS